MCCRESWDCRSKTLYNKAYNRIRKNQNGYKKNKKKRYSFVNDLHADGKNLRQTNPTTNGRYFRSMKLEEDCAVIGEPGKFYYTFSLAARASDVNVVISIYGK